MTPGAKAARQPSRLEADIVDAHRATRRPSPRQLGLRGTVPALAIRLDAATQAGSRRCTSAPTGSSPSTGASARSSTTKARGKSPGQERYLLDYAPDFLEGLGKKLDGHHRPRRRGAAHPRRGHARAWASPRTASRSPGCSAASCSSPDGWRSDCCGTRPCPWRRSAWPRSWRTWSGAASSKDRIVVPVDAHPEIFGVRARNGDGAGQAMRPPARQGHPALAAHRVRRGEGTAGRAVAGGARRRHRRAA